MASKKKGKGKKEKAESAVAGLKGVTLVGDESGQSVEGYFLQRKNGKVFGPFKSDLVVEMIQGGKLTGTEKISENKKLWNPILADPLFTEHFRARLMGLGDDDEQVLSDEVELPLSRELGRDDDPELPTSYTQDDELDVELPISRSREEVELPLAISDDQSDSSLSDITELPLPVFDGDVAELPFPIERSEGFGDEPLPPALLREDSPGMTDGLSTSAMDESLPLPASDYTATGFDVGFNEMDLGQGASAEASTEFEDQFFGEAPPDSTLERMTVDTQAVRSQKVTKKKAKKKARNTPTLVALLGLSVLITVAYYMGVFDVFLFQNRGETIIPEQAEILAQQAMLAEAEPEIIAPIVPLVRLENGRFGDYRAFILDAMEAANMSEGKDIDAVSRLIIGQALMEIQYRTEAVEVSDVEARVAFLSEADVREPLHQLAQGAYVAAFGDLRIALPLLEPLLMGSEEYAHWAHLFTGLALFSEFTKNKYESERIEVSIEGAEDPSEAVIEELREDIADNAEAAEASEDQAVAEENDETEEEPVIEEVPPGAAEVGNEQRALLVAAHRHLLTSARLRNQMVPAQYYLGMVEEEEGDLEQAFIRYNAAITIASDHVPSRLSLNELNVQLGHFEMAISDIYEMLESSDFDLTLYEQARANYILGQIEWSHLRMDNALAYFTTSLTKNPTDREAQQAYVRIMVDREKYLEAMNFLSEIQTYRDEIDMVLSKVEVALAQEMALHTPTSEGLRRVTESLDSIESFYPVDSRVFFYRGVLRLTDGHSELAKESLRSSIACNLEFGRPYQRMAQILWEEGEEGQAMEWVEQANNLRNIDVWTLLDIGQMLVEWGMNEMAAEQYRMAIEIDPFNPIARLMLANYLLSIGDDQSLVLALSELERLRIMGIVADDLFLLFAEVYYRLGQYAEASGNFELLSEPLRESPTSSLLYLMGRVNFDSALQMEDEEEEGEIAQRINEASEQFRTAFETGRRSAETLYWEGRANLELGQYAEAREIFEDAVELAFSNQGSPGEYLYWQGRTLEAAQQYAEALESYVLVDTHDLRWSLENPDVFYRRGYLNSAEGNMRAAERDLKTAIVMEPANYSAVSALARVYDRQQNSALSLELWARALSLKEDEPETHFEMGMRLNQMERREEAIQHLQRSRELGYGEQQPLLYRTLGYLYRDTGMRQDAIAELEIYLEEERLERQSSLRLEVENQIARLRQGQ
jgi:tetratricopeptide (TPR) repeat protein